MTIIKNKIKKNLSPITCLPPLSSIKPFIYFINLIYLILKKTNPPIFCQNSPANQANPEKINRFIRQGFILIGSRGLHCCQHNINTPQSAPTVLSHVCAFCLEIHFTDKYQKPGIRIFLFLLPDQQNLFRFFRPNPDFYCSHGYLSSFHQGCQASCNKGDKQL